MSPGEFLPLTFGIPLIGAFLILFLRRWPNVRETVTLVSGAFLFFLVVSLYPAVARSEKIIFDFFEVLPGIHIVFQLEPLGWLFALAASGLWILTSVYSIGYMRKNQESHQTRFYTCFAFAIASTIGIAFAGNLITLFIFYEMLTLTTYPLVTHKGTEEAKRAGRIYLGILLTTSIVFFLFAILWTYHLTGSLDFKQGGILAGHASPITLGLLLGLFAFGIGKAALMPFHRWLPAAMVAPTPVSALLHAVAVVKAGVFTLMKIIIYIFGIDLLQQTGISIWLMYVAGATILIASGIALTKDNLKARLAYSTVSQLAYIVLGAALANAWGVIGGSMHILMHAFGKITLFFCAGAIYITTGKTKVSEMDGLGKKMPFTFIAFFIASLSVIGLPPSGGSWSKWLLVAGTVETGHLLLAGVLILSTLLNVAYLMPISIRAFFKGNTHSQEESRIAEAPLLCLVPLCLTAGGSFFLFFYADYLYRFLRLLVYP